MTDRIPLDHLTSDQYDQLCDALGRVREIASRLFMAGRTQTEREIGRQLSSALDQSASATGAPQPREHCGDLKPPFSDTAERTECVLRPGHTGSHADQHDTRWWRIDQEQQ